ncbi:MarR family winged helix-turn-helix transcriptional regulator [Rhodococcus sp. H29-C3]|uniref:MarR family winged helix-turn-helix transcriptional regulator n=1 Tax=Rhodococcus sp. H29-C3 TaxID=3046307 RepID=UPI0024BB5678|nr:MarR family winged helix-turn-helix transcriptional regulator [Rhodococcus sp. H29-C3]MDJ0363286.1 MarR family winged helix-turn-helix transcriptional regulator [Rhodococcus sp. H29-C3]
MTGGGNQQRLEPDLAALIFQVVPRLGALEEPILSEAGLSMWEYAILTEVAGGTAMSQKELSGRTNRDPTRLGRHLNDLSARGLIARERAPDQRQRAINITPSGQAVLDTVRRRVRTVEDDLLHNALSTDAATFRDLLARLAAACK